MHSRCGFARARSGGLAAFIAALWLAAPLRRLTSRSPGSLPLFDGKTLEGWTKVGGEASYRVEQGEIIGKVGTGPNTFLCTEKSLWRLHPEARGQA